MMLRDMKPGHVLNFATDPATITSPKGSGNASLNDNTLETPWPTTSSLGIVKCTSHPSGPLGSIAAEVATKTRDGFKVARSLSYSGPGRALGASDKIVGSLNCDFVGYVDGQSNYTQSSKHVFSKDFSGCLMVAYTVGGVRRVAHAASSSVPTMDCKQAFLTKLQNSGALLHGWFQPFVAARDNNKKADAFNVVKKHIGMQINNLVTFGVILQDNTAYAIDAFKPSGIAGSNWIVTDVTPHAMRNTWVYTPST